jgi:hypothetical protein
MSFINNILKFFRTIIPNVDKKSHIDMQNLDAKLIDDSFLTPHCPYINKSIPKHFNFVDI